MGQQVGVNNAPVVIDFGKGIKVKVQFSIQPSCPILDSELFKKEENLSQNQPVGEFIKVGEEVLDVNDVANLQQTIQDLQAENNELTQKLCCFDANKDKLEAIYRDEKKLSTQFGYMVSLLESQSQKMKEKDQKIKKQQAQIEYMVTLMEK